MARTYARSGEGELALENVKPTDSPIYRLASEFAVRAFRKTFAATRDRREGRARAWKSDGNRAAQGRIPLPMYARSSASERTIGRRIPPFFLSLSSSPVALFVGGSWSPPTRKKRRKTKREREKGGRKERGRPAGVRPISFAECSTHPSSEAARAASCGTAALSSSGADHAFIARDAGRRDRRARRAFHLENREKRRATFLPRYTGRPTLRRRAVPSAVAQLARARDATAASRARNSNDHYVPLIREGFLLLEVIEFSRQRIIFTLFCHKDYSHYEKMFRFLNKTDFC